MFFPVGKNLLEGYHFLEGNYCLVLNECASFTSAAMINTSLGALVSYNHLRSVMIRFTIITFLAEKSSCSGMSHDTILLFSFHQFAYVLLIQIEL